MMVRRLSDHFRRRIVQLRPNHGITEIVKILKREGCVVTRASVYNLLKKWDTHGTIGDLPRPVRDPVDVSLEILDFIDNTMKNNDETTARRLGTKLTERFNVHFSLSKIKRLRRGLGWLATGSKYCQLVREANRVKRLEFAQLCLRNQENFEDVLWSDESCIQLDWNGKLSFHRWWEPPNLKGKPKHPFKFCVWACISKKGACDILIFSGIMDAIFYCEEILQNTLAPFITETFPDGHRFMQDNDPKHTSNRAKETFQRLGINWWKTPPESPDMNPIENLWHELKETLRNDVKPRTKEELEAGIKQFWAGVTAEKCQRYIGHLKKVVPRVVERNGRATGF